MPKKVFEGKVVSDKMQKTVVVEVQIPKTHPIYGKKVRNSKKFKARNEIDAAAGDIVRIEESRPYSKTVTWKVVEIVEKGEPAPKAKKALKKGKK